MVTADVTTSRGLGGSYPRLPITVAVPIKALIRKELRCTMAAPVTLKRKGV